MPGTEGRLGPGLVLGELRFRDAREEVGERSIDLGQGMSMET